MPVSSHQISQMISGQQAMFGNTATYARQISPMGRSMGATPTYANPYGPTAAPGAADYNTGTAMAPGMLNAAASYGAPVMMGAGMMMGGRMGAMLDPFTAGMRGFGAGAGWQGGAGITANIGNLARGGIGGLARGVGMAGLAAAPVMGMYAAGKYAFGQMAQGAQFQGAVNSSLQNNFRFSNDQSSTGQGFSHGEQRQIGSMLQTMGTQDMMTTPQELLGVVNKGASMGVFRGVQDAREFKQRFTQMKESLKEIASTFNTTLSEALPFFKEARQQGFWTPQDITRHSAQVRQVQANTGMSASQSQQLMGMGANMIRGIGGTGQQGSSMMAQAQMMSGSALFGGVVNGKSLANAGFGTGAEGAQNLGNMLAGATARFSRSRVGRWAMAGLMNKEGTGLDQEGLQSLTSGNMGIREIGRRARGNVSGSRAYDFKLNEGEMRGQLAEQGPGAALGIVKSLVGSRLHGESGKDKLITRRIIQRFMGGNARQADIVAKMAREMPRMMAIQAARSEGSMDAQERQRSEMMNDTYEGFKRRLGQWWKEKVDAPMQEAGAAFSYRVGKSWERFQDRMFGTGGRSVGLSAEAVRSMVRSAETGNMSYIRKSFGTSEDMNRFMGGDNFRGGQVGSAGSAMMSRLGFSGSGGVADMAAGSGVGGSIYRALFSRGKSFSRGDIDKMGALSRGSQGIVGDEEASALGFGSTGEMSSALGGAGSKQIQEYLGTGEALSVRGAFGANMDAEDREKYAAGIVSRIQMGRAGSEAQKMFEGLSRTQGIARVQAMQGSARGKFTGLGSLGGMTDFSGQGMRARIEQRQIASVEDLATLMRGGESDSWYSEGKGAAISGGILGVAVTEQGIEEIKKDARGEQAMMLFAEATSMENDGASPEEVAAKRKKARGLMAEMASSGENLTKSARSAAIRMANEGDPQADAIAKMAGKVGAGMAAGNRAAFERKIKGRRRRLSQALGGEGRAALEKLAGGEGTELGDAVRQALSTTSGAADDPGSYVKQMSALARAAAEDPDKANQMLALLKEKGMDNTSMGVLLRESRNVQGTAKRYGLKEDIGEGDKITERARRGVSMRLKQLAVKGIKGKELDELIRGGDTDAIRKQLEAQKYKKKDIDEMLDTMKGGMTRGELVETGARHAAARTITTLDEKVAKRAGLDPSELTGKIGARDTPTVVELKVHTQWFNKIHDVLLQTNRGEKVPTKDKKEKK